MKERPTTGSPGLDAAYRAAGAIYEAGSVDAARHLLAANFLLDRDADGWLRDLAELKKKVGACDTTSALDPKSALEGEFTWRCATGRVAGSILLAPTDPPLIQALDLKVK
jgi:hypothetical protein